MAVPPTTCWPPRSAVQLPYLTAPAARGVVARCAGALPVGAPAQVTVRDLPQGSGVFRSYPVLCGM